MNIDKNKKHSSQYLVTLTDRDEDYYYFNVVSYDNPNYVVNANCDLIRYHFDDESTKILNEMKLNSSMFALRIYNMKPGEPNIKIELLVKKKIYRPFQKI